MLGKVLHLVKHSSNLHSLLGNMAFTLFSLATFLLMVRLLAKDVYGQWVIYVTTTSLLDMLRLGLTGTAAIRLLSTAAADNQKHVIASSYHLSIATTVLIAILFIGTYLIAGKYIGNSYYLPVLLFYPFLSAANLSYNQAITLSQGFVDFKRILAIRIINGALVFFFITGYILFIGKNLYGIIIAHIAANALTSMVTMIKRWDGLQHIRRRHHQTLKQILQFGKYSTASYIGSNLLRGSDTIIISLSSAMGATAVAIYAIPLKFVELAEIPLRSFTATAFPKLSHSYSHNKAKFNYQINLYLIATTLLLLPGLAILIIFPSFFLHLVGGSQYADALQLQKEMVYILSGYILLLPLDRYSGVALFAIDKPRVNFVKIMVMLAANIVFDLIAVFVFQSLLMVVLASVLFTFAGIFIGWGYLYRATGYSLRSIPADLDATLKRISNRLYNALHGKRNRQ